MGRPRLPVELERLFWRAIREGLTIEAAAVAAGIGQGTASRWFGHAGGVIPSIVNETSGRCLSFAEREEIAHMNSAGAGVRQIARAVGRDPGTISRELRLRTVGVRGYRASVAQSLADAASKRPKDARLATSLPLRKEVQNRLKKNHSPTQIAGRLRQKFPEDPEMWVSHETIYQSLYVQGRGGLKRDLVKHLRTGRAVRKPRRKEGERRGRIPDMIMISERPPEIEDRAVPGHWEGDLITGAHNASAIGTLVERKTGYLTLLHLPADHGALAVQDAMIEAMSELSETLRRTLTWDQGSEMSNHVKIAEATGLDIYFCDPHSPWQRGSNENTNGLLRQYFPKGTDLSVHGKGYLEFVAAEINNRPRDRHNWATPAEVLDKLLSEASNPPGVAPTG